MKILVLYGSSRLNGNMKGEGRHSRDEGYSAEYGGGGGVPARRMKSLI